MIKEYVLNMNDSKNSSQIRHERHASHDIYLANIGEELDQQENSREQYLQNLQGSFVSANDSSIASWGKTESESNKSDKDNEKSLKDDLEDDVPSHKLKIRKSKAIRAKSSYKSSSDSL